MKRGGHPGTGTLPLRAANGTLAPAGRGAAETTAQEEALGMRHLLTWILGAWALIAAGAAAASGFAIPEQGARPTGTAMAGVGSGTTELSAAFWNPAGMAADPRPGIGLGAAYIEPEITFSGQSPDGGDAGKAETPPHLFARAPVSDSITGGFSLNVPFGLSTTWDNGWAGRYHALESGLSVRQGTLSGAGALGGGLSLGGGLAVQRLDVKLTSAVDQSPLASDGSSKVDGDSTAFGWVAGLHWQGEAASAGLSYHSGVGHEIDGESALRLATGDQTVPAEARLELPARAIAAIRRDVGADLTVLASLVWTEWSAYDELKMSFPGSGLPDAVAEKDWEDVWAGALGLELDPGGAWILRGGYRFEQSPVPSAKRRDPRLPGADRQRLALGTTWRGPADWSLDLAYNYLWLADGDIHNTDAQGHTLDGTFESRAHIAELQVNKRF